MKPFKLHPAQADLMEKNQPNAPGARQSAMWDFSKEDLLPGVEFNEIIWKSVHGADSPTPAPFRSAFVRAIEDDDDEKEERREVRRKAG